MANGQKRDYYEILGVPKGTSENDLKRAYRKLAKDCHPDLHPGDKTAEARFKELNEAYEILSDPEKKAKYDQFGHAGVDPNFGGGAGFGGFDMGDIFSSFFGGFGGFGGAGGETRGARNGPVKGGNIRTSVTITLEEAAFGAKKEVTINHLENCDGCKGTGCAEGTTAEVCPNCHGSGSVRVQQRTMFGSMSTTTVCPNCRGEGKIIHQPCKSCGGAGAVRRQKKISVNIPAGIDDGQAISLRGQGDVGKNGGPAGDLIIGIQVKPHPMLRREGTSIYLDRKISFLQAALGAEIEIPTLDGKVKYTIPAGTQTGTTFRLREKGVPLLNGRGRGDQLVTVKVEVPQNLNQSQREALHHFGVTMGEVEADIVDTTTSQEEEPPASRFKKRKKK